nr:relaxase/mobilization nuclease domain-containing protein [uncultured Ruminococcus sp.]
MVSGVNCDGENAFREFMATKRVHDKANGIFFYHYAQSFPPTEKITPEQAHEIALEFAEKAWAGHEVLVTTHCDANHIHSHFVINSVGFESGMKLRQSPSTLKKLRKLSDEICIAHGLSVLQPYEGGGRSMSSREYRARLRGNSWKQRLANDIDKAMEYSGSKDEFIRSMSILGYHMTWTDERKYLTFHCPNGKSCRDIRLHVNSCKESFPTAVRAKSSRQAGRIRASFTSSISENALLQKRNRRELLTVIPMLAAESAALPERYPESLTTIPKTLTSAESVSKPKKTEKRLVQLSERVSVCWLMRYPIQQR